MALRNFERHAYRIFGARASVAIERNAHLKISLQKAHIYLRPDVYLSAIYYTVALVAVLTMVPALFLLGLSIFTDFGLPLRFLVVVMAAPFMLGAMIYLFALILPDLRARSRARDIDAKLPYALNFISTMASAGATPNTIFLSLSKQPIYGNVADESAWISRDLELLGTDIVTALGRGIDRSPSAKFQDLLQGAITTLSSGSDLKTYFRNKAEQFIYENRQEQHRFLDSLGVLAESFVTVVVAAPLFLIVILSVMTSLGGSPEQTLLIGYILVMVLIPLSQAGFAFTINTMTPEA